MHICILNLNRKASRQENLQGVPTTHSFTVTICTPLLQLNRASEGNGAGSYHLTGLVDTLSKTVDGGAVKLLLLIRHSDLPNLHPSSPFTLSSSANTRSLL